MSASPAALARAFVAACGDDAKTLESTVADLALWAEVCGDDALRAVLENPRVDAMEKARIVDAASADTAPIVRAFVLLLAANRTLRQLGSIARATATIVDERLGRVTATVETAGKLSKETIAELTAALEKETGKTVRVTTIANDTLIGGIKVRLGDDVIDASLAGRLARLARAV